MVKGIPKIVAPDNTRTACVIGKQPRLAFKSNLKMRSKDVLNVVFSDNCGPFEVPSIGGKKNTSSPLCEAMGVPNQGQE